MGKLHLKDPVTRLPGIGQVGAASLAKAGIFVVQDVLDFFPVSYKDYTAPVSLDEADGEPHLYAAVVNSPPQGAQRPGVHVLNVQVRSETGRTEAAVRLFNQAYMAARLEPETQIFLDGTARVIDGQLCFSAPKVITALPEQRIMPVYRNLPGIQPGRFSKAVRAALEALPETDVFSSDFRRRYGVMPLRDAYHAVHAPRSLAEQELGRRRFDFEETLITTRSLDLMETEQTGENCRHIRAAGRIPEFEKLLPFVPTAAQRQAMQDIVSDLDGDRLMNRLLEGDVGSGKTAVAMFAMFAAAAEGCQSFLLAPTEILAAQHARTVRSVLGADRTVLITGSMPAPERRRAEARIRSGEVSYIVGTQALLYGRLDPPRPALLVADEQHRFGVRQRRVLLAEQGGLHSLIVSATPIPRSLSLAESGMMQLSVLEERPADRLPIETRFVPRQKLRDMYDFLAERARAGERTYVVCPLVEPDPDGRLCSAAAVQARLAKLYPDLCIGLLHGRMGAPEKQEALRAFQEGETPVLVSTTVIEVGVDVPEATAIVIHDAERFGLAQLHQLRGRVGRGSRQSWCFLASGSAGARRRLDVLCRTQNGFEVAEADMRERGAGEILGLRQHGHGTAMLDIRDASMLGHCREILQETSADPQLLADWHVLNAIAVRRLEDAMRQVVLN